MADVEDYLLTGVMNGNGLDVPLPFSILDLQAAVLDAADEFIDDWRRRDRLFDAACDARARGWAWAHLPYDRLRPGLTVHLTVGGGRRTVWGKLTSVRENGASVEGEQYGFRRDDWTDAADVLVPVPVDLATLGEYPPVAAG